MTKEKDHILELIHYYQQYGNVVFLESQKEDHPSSTKSYIAAKPKAWIKSVNNEVFLFEEGIKSQDQGNSWDAISAFRRKYKRWMFGYFGYDLKNEIEALESNNDSLIDIPDMFFMIPEVLIEVLSTGQLNYIYGKPEIKSITRNRTAEFQLSKQNSISQKAYIDKVKRAQEHIEEGDYYEINLSRPLVYDFEGDPIELYKAMCEAGPVPFASYIYIDGVSVCCSSPERFLARKGNQVWSQPIKGTISKGMGNDDEKIKELQASEKDRAENLMIVDLVRNDLSRVAKKGSVNVRDLFEIQSFETVHQMVSTVECEVSQHTDSVDIIKACFPMGSMTGAPKISAMQSIEHLENYKRGIYSGAIGYFTPEQDFDFNVVIRSAIIEAQKLVYPVGGAITSDSVPENEWEETIIKARALTNTQ